MLGTFVPLTKVMGGWTDGFEVQSFKSPNEFKIAETAPTMLVTMPNTNTILIRIFVARDLEGHDGEYSANSGGKINPTTPLDTAPENSSTNPRSSVAQAKKSESRNKSIVKRRCRCGVMGVLEP